jgi:Zn-dependent protease/predicted transcriptional regulator
MAVATTLGLVGSILFHEMAHALVARRHGIAIRGITLFIFGGVAEMEAEPASARGELLMAIAGPIASLVLGFFLFFLLSIWPVRPAVAGVLWYLGLINGSLACFNLVPAFPLDGGRVLRAALWLWRGDFAWATRISTRIGSGFGFFLMLLGALRVLTGDFVGGVWGFLIGLFLRAAATGSYMQTTAGRLLAGLHVGDVMNNSPIAVPSDTLISDFEGYVYSHHHRWFPVTEDGTLVGSVSTKEVAAIDRGLWDETPVGRIMTHLTPDQLTTPESDLMHALMQMQRGGASRLMVTRNGQRLVGLLSSRDILRELALRRELARP